MLRVNQSVDTPPNELLNFINTKLELYNKLSEDRVNLMFKKMWFDDKFGRLTTEEKGQYLGKFEPDDKVLVIYRDGNYEITDQELTQKFDPEAVLLIELFNPEKILGKLA